MRAQYHAEWWEGGADSEGRPLLLTKECATFQDAALCAAHRDHFNEGIVTVVVPLVRNARVTLDESTQHTAWLHEGALKTAPGAPTWAN